MILRYIIWAIVIYALFRLIFDVIIPIARVSGQMKRKMREFQDTVHQQQQHHQSPQKTYTQPAESKSRSGDYIDFEEVK